MVIPSSVFVSDCCHALVMSNESDGSDECMQCGKPCKRDGTIGEYYEKREAEKEQPSTKSDAKRG